MIISYVSAVPKKVLQLISASKIIKYFLTQTAPKNQPVMWLKGNDFD
jgi:hypothetical protein